MKFIGEQFKEKREEIGISISEVSNDLKIDSIIIENLEDGNDKVFKDILELKEMISLYSKYLDLDEEKILDDLNDYLFEKTSKISADDIKDIVSKAKVEEDNNKIKTPYTSCLKKVNKDNSTIIFAVILGLLLLLLLLFYFVLRKSLIG